MVCGGVGFHDGDVGVGIRRGPLRNGKGFRCGDVEAGGVASGRGEVPGRGVGRTSLSYVHPSSPWSETRWVGDTWSKRVGRGRRITGPGRGGPVGVGDIRVGAGKGPGEGDLGQGGLRCIKWGGTSWRGWVLGWERRSGCLKSRPLRSPERSRCRSLGRGGVGTSVWRGVPGWKPLRGGEGSRDGVSGAGVSVEEGWDVGVGEGSGAGTLRRGEVPGRGRRSGCLRWGPLRGGEGSQGGVSVEEGYDVRGGRGVRGGGLDRAGESVRAGPGAVSGNDDGSPGASCHVSSYWGFPTLSASCRRRLTTNKS